LARATTTRVREAARGAGAPSDAEIEELSRAHWREVDCPEQAKAVHAVALRVGAPRASTKSDLRARAVAAELLEAARGASDASEFEAKTKAVPHLDVDVRVERLGAFASDTRVVEGPEGARMDKRFTDAAFKLQAGQTSDVVETDFGWHVIRVLERKAPVFVPFEARRTAFAEEATTLRARRELDARIEAQKKSLSIELMPGVEALMTVATTPQGP
jgi:hypothetical protein